MSTSGQPYEVHTEARGPHWVSWITRPGSTKPDRAIILVAANRKDAEDRAHQWAAQNRY